MPSSLTTPRPYIIEAIIETESFSDDDPRAAIFAFEPFFDQTYLTSPDEILPSGALLNDPLAEFIGIRAAIDGKLGAGLCLEEWINTQVAYARGLLRPETVGRYKDGGCHFLGSSDRDDMRAFILDIANLHYAFAPVYAHFKAEGQLSALSLAPSAWPADSRLIGVALSGAPDTPDQPAPHDGSNPLDAWKTQVQEELDWLTTTLVSFTLINPNGLIVDSVDGLPLKTLSHQLTDQVEVRELAEGAAKHLLGCDTITDEDLRAHVHLRDRTGLGLTL